MKQSLTFFGEKKDEISPFFSLFISHLDKMSKHQLKIFRVLDKLALIEEGLKAEAYLYQALALLSKASSEFIKQREEEFFYNFLKKLSIIKILDSHKPFITIFSHSVSFPFQTKPVLGILIQNTKNTIGISAIKRLIDSELSLGRYIEGSYLSFGDTQNEYFEIQDATVYRIEEIQALLESKFLYLQEKLRRFHEGSLNREFFIKSFRWIMNEIHQGDLPQVCIDFSRHETGSLVFIALICNLASKGEASLNLKLKHPYIEIESYIKEPQINGVKEGVISKVTIPSDFEKSLIESRLEVSKLVRELIGPFRDVNGGLLEKIEENFQTLKNNLPVSSMMVRRFLSSIYPQEAQATTSVSILEDLFNSIEKEKDQLYENGFSVHESENSMVITGKGNNPKFCQNWIHSFNKAFSKGFYFTSEYDFGTLFGLILIRPSLNQRDQLKAFTASTYNNWIGRKENKQSLTLCTTSNFISLDPRIGAEERSSYLCHMLFEGLMRKTSKGELKPAIAESYSISEDGRHYRFHLRKSYWSNGTPLTAEDFVHSWRTSLTPGFVSQLSFLFFAIKNAKNVKEGKVPTSDLGIKATSSYVLDIELTDPYPHFLEMCTLSVFSPISHVHDHAFPSWVEGAGESYLCNGPFFLEKRTSQCVSLRKNPYYFNSKHIEIEKITLSIATQESALEGYLNQQIDALIDPLCNIGSYRNRLDSETTLAPGTIHTRYLCLNCALPPFERIEVRQALSLALSRASLAKEFRSDALPHYSLLSSAFKSLGGYRLNEDLHRAKEVLQKVIHHSPNLERLIFYQKLHAWEQHYEISNILVRYLNETLGFSWEVSLLDKVIPSQLMEVGKLTAFIYGWTERMSYPEYFIHLFSDANNIGNFTKWTSKKIQEMIQGAANERSESQRLEIYKEIEKHLCQELPMIPILYTPNYSCYHSSSLMAPTSKFMQFDPCYAKKL